MRAAALALTLLSVAARPVASQPDPASYLDIVNTYAEGQTDEAVGMLARWSDDAARKGARALAAGAPEPHRVEAAVMLHSDLALATIAEHPERADRQIEIARDLVGSRVLDLPSEAAFKLRWYELAVSLLISQWQPKLAQDYIRLGLYFSDDKVLVLDNALVSLMELRASEANPRGEGTVNIESPLPGTSSKSSARERASRESRLRAAENACRRAVKIDPQYLDAHLRLGWILLLSNVRGKARDEFALVQAQTTRDDQRYLATMFIGAVDVADGHEEAAARAYDAASAIGPGYQSALVALSQAELALGRPDRSRAIVLRLAARRGDPPKDPWWDFYLGAVDEDALTWLRAEAQRR